MSAAEFGPLADSGAEASNSSSEPSFGEIAARRLSRRAALTGMLAATAAGAWPGLRASPAAAEAAATTGFAEVSQGVDEHAHVPAGYRLQVLLRWGDPLFAEAPAFDVARQSAAAQRLQFGYNCDFLCFFPLPADRSAGPRPSSGHGLLVVNHEYTNAGLMFPELGPGRDAAQKASREQTEVEMAAIGASVVEVRREADGWKLVDGAYGRRLTAETPMILSGPAAGHPRLRTAADPTGWRVAGMLANCAGGQTPWGTVLTGEENFHAFFGGPGGNDPLRRRYGVSGRSWYAWHRYHPRFDLEVEPNEPNRFGWIVEFDPYDPASTPVKRTALGRFKHEGATTVVNGDGRVVVYQGDDERFEYVYKFVTARAYDPSDRTANRDLLDEGTLYAARFHDDGRLEWLPLVQGQGPLTAENGFADQADVLIDVRRAADLVKATPMDRPEDVEADPATGRVYVTLTNNVRRKPDGLDRANPRAANKHGHVIEMIPPDGAGGPDHAAAEGRWEMFLQAGRPGTDPGAAYHPDTSERGWLSGPDNLAFDAGGRIWIATDSGLAAGVADGLYVADTAGPQRALTRRFFRAPIGAEVTGPCFTPDGRTLFLSVQHPGQSEGSHFGAPSTRWPDFADGMPPRPSVVVIAKDDDGPIGS